MIAQVDLANYTFMCQKCGKCCEHITLYIGEIKDLEFIKWVEAHGIKIKDGFIDFPIVCKNLDPTSKKCMIYNNRPTICQKYLCSENRCPFSEYKDPEKSE